MTIMLMMTNFSDVYDDDDDDDDKYYDNEADLQFTSDRRNLDKIMCSYATTFLIRLSPRPVHCYEILNSSYPKA